MVMVAQTMSQLLRCNVSNGECVLVRTETAARGWVDVPSGVPVRLLLVMSFFRLMIRSWLWW
jgi:hypothetical protein